MKFILIFILLLFRFKFIFIFIHCFTWRLKWSSLSESVPSPSHAFEFSFGTLLDASPGLIDLFSLFPGSMVEFFGGKRGKSHTKIGTRTSFHPEQCLDWSPSFYLRHKLSRIHSPIIIFLISIIVPHHHNCSSSSYDDRTSSAESGEVPWKGRNVSPLDRRDVALDLLA